MALIVELKLNAKRFIKRQIHREHFCVQILQEILTLKITIESQFLFYI
jgi:hypothetical protein